ncbi:unnamed protein product [Anisakis simplex]|uniref:Uncharacterized protein n=1 Tax=Anisakis simplex TaxID=6269 RepID=A0A0M3KGP4_ANISI|nr:unnamed protein product [Anisakis simplex]
MLRSSKEALDKQRNSGLRLMEPKQILKHLQSGRLLHPNDLLLAASSQANADTKHFHGSIALHPLQRFTADVLTNKLHAKSSASKSPIVQNADEERLRQLRTALNRANHLGWIW